MVGQDKSALKHQSGLSLIEMLIAIPLGLLVVVAVLKIFTANISGVNIQNNYARVQENSRVSMQLLSRDIRNADYWGCVNDSDSINNNLNSSDSDYGNALIPIAQAPVSASNDVTTHTLDDISVKQGTDILTLWGAQKIHNAKILSPYMTTTASALTISTGSDIEQGDLLLISDCQQSDLFTNSSTTTATNGIVTHSTDTLGSGSVDNSRNDLSAIYGASAQLLSVYSKSYFIGSNSAGGQSLYRLQNGNASELVRDINDLQLTFGEDTNGNGSVDSFASADSVIDMDNVNSIRVQLVSENGTGASLISRTYTMTANIRNRTLQ